MKKVLILTIAILALSILPAYCAVNYNSWGNTDLHPLLGRELPYDLIYGGASRGGVSTQTSGMHTITVAGYSVVNLPADNGDVGVVFTLADGKQGQIITIVASARTSSETKVITPNLCTGFTTITLDAALDSVTLLYVDDTTGWIHLGGYGQVPA